MPVFTYCRVKLRVSPGETFELPSASVMSFTDLKAETNGAGGMTVTLLAEKLVRPQVSVGFILRTQEVAEPTLGGVNVVVSEVGLAKVPPQLLVHT